VLLALALSATGAIAQSRSPGAMPDSGTQVSRVRVSSSGIEIDGRTVRDTSRGSSFGRSDRYDRAARRRDRGRARIDIDAHQISVDEHGRGIVRIWSDARVPAGQVVDGDVVAVFGSVTVEGAVTGDVVAVFGSVRLKDGARVDGDAVSIGGSLDQGQDVTVKGETVQMGLTPITLGLPARSMIVFAVGAGWLVSMFTGWIFALMFPSGMLRVATVIERRPAASFFLGALSVPGFMVALILLCITVIGIPLAVLLPMVYMLVGYAGQLAATALLGARVLRRGLAAGFMAPLLVGTLFVAALLGAGGVLMVGGGAGQPVAFFLLLLGGLMLLGLGALGTGAVMLSRFGTRPREVVWQGHAPLPSGVVQGPLSPPATG
jgi:hypothetical protein